MSYKPIYSFSDSMEGKLVRFKNATSAPNLSSMFKISKTHADELHVPAGALGVIYEIRGATMFIGFGRDLKQVSEKHTSPAFFSATIQLYIDDSHLVEVES